MAEEEGEIHVEAATQMQAAMQTKDISHVSKAPPARSKNGRLCKRLVRPRILVPVCMSRLTHTQ